MAGTRDFLAEAFEMIGTSMLEGNSDVPPGTPAPATPSQTQDEGNQPPHARDPDPTAGDIEPWLLVNAPTQTNAPATQAAQAEDTPAPAPAPQPHSPTIRHEPPQAMPGTLRAAIQQSIARMGNIAGSHHREWAWKREVGGTTA